MPSVLFSTCSCPLQHVSSTSPSIFFSLAPSSLTLFLLFSGGGEGRWRLGRRRWWRRRGRQFISMHVSWLCLMCLLPSVYIFTCFTYRMRHSCVYWAWYICWMAWVNPTLPSQANGKRLPSIITRYHYYGIFPPRRTGRLQCPFPNYCFPFGDLNNSMILRRKTCASAASQFMVFLLFQVNSVCIAFHYQFFGRQVCVAFQCLEVEEKERHVLMSVFLNLLVWLLGPWRCVFVMVTGHPTISSVWRTNSNPLTVFLILGIQWLWMEEREAATYCPRRDSASDRTGLGTGDRTRWAFRHFYPGIPQPSNRQCLPRHSQNLTLFYSVEKDSHPRGHYPWTFRHFSDLCVWDCYATLWQNI